MADLDPAAPAPAAPAAAPVPAAAPAAADPAAPAPAADANAAAPAAPVAPAADSALKPDAAAPGTEKIDAKESGKPDSSEKPPETVKPGDKPTLLEEIVDPNAKKDDKAPGEAPSDKKPADSAPAVVFEPYKLPEGLKADEKVVGQFNELLIKPDVTPQQRGQELLDLHVSELQKYDQALRDEQQRTFDEMRSKWRTELMSDPEMGGSGFNTTKTEVAKMRDLFVSMHPRGSEKYMEEHADFNRFLRYTGAGDSPVFWRLMHNVARRFNEPAAPSLEFKPPPDIDRNPNKGRRGLRGTLYDHPSSQQNRG